MRRLLVVTLALSLTGTACAGVSQWWTNFTQNPVAQIQSFEQEIQTVLTILEGAWVFIEPLIPASSQPAAKQQYANAIAAVGDAESILQDGVNAAVAAQQTPMPDFSALIQATTNAVDNVIAIIDLYRGTAPVAIPDAGPTMGVVVKITPPHLEDARAKNAVLKKFHVVVK